MIINLNIYIGCAVPDWYGDGYCDDENNNESCGYDGGDCCGEDVNTSYCSACICYDSTFSSTTTTTSDNI